MEDNYLEKIPHELKLIIISYLDLNSFITYINSNFLIANDYISLIRIKSPCIYELNPFEFIKLDLKFVYLRLLEHFQKYSKLYIATLLNNNRIKKEINFYNYLESNSKQQMKLLRNAYAKDDVELYKKYSKFDSILDVKSYSFYYATHRLNVLSYSLSILNNDKQFNMILMYFIRNTNTKLDQVKFIFNNCKFNNAKILMLLCNGKSLTLDSFNYILDTGLDNCSVLLNSNEVYDAFMTLNEFLNFDFFKILWNKFGYLLTHDQIHKIIKYIQHKFNKNTMLKIIIYILQHSDIGDHIINWLS